MVDAIVHLAAIVGDPACSRQPELAHEVNLEATQALLDDAERAASSASSSRQRAATTDRWTATLSQTRVRAPADLALRGDEGRGRTGGSRSKRSLAATCLRFATVYGTSPRMRFDLTVNDFSRDWRLSKSSSSSASSSGGRTSMFETQLGRSAGCSRLPAKTSPARCTTSADLRELPEARHRRAAARAVPGRKVEFVHRDEDPRDYRVSFEKFAAAAVSRQSILWHKGSTRLWRLLTDFSTILTIRSTVTEAVREYPRRVVTTSEASSARTPMRIEKVSFAPPRNGALPRNALTIDVEDWYQSCVDFDAPIT